MNLLYFFEKIRFSPLTEFMLAITHLGEETAFLVLALFVFWCVDKKRGYFVLIVGFIGTTINQFLKLVCRIPRPWILDPDFTIVEKARAAADGFSFPSGHTQSAVGAFGAIAYRNKKKWLAALLWTIAALVSVSRMYLGVHTPYDVGFSLIASAVLIIAAYPFVMEKDGRYMPACIAVMFVCSLAYLLYVEVCSFPADMDQDNLLSGIKNAYTLLGCVCGIAVVYWVDTKWLHFPTEAIWWAQILKFVGGLIVVLLVKEGLKVPFNAVLPAYPARALRYCLVVLVAGIVWPLTFRWFSGLGKRRLNP